MKLTIPVIALSLICGSSGLHAATSLLPISLPSFTDNILTYNDGAAYAPLYPASNQTLGGVPFKFESDASGNNIFLGGTLSAPVTASLNIPINLPSITSAYALINTIGGSPGIDSGSIKFEGTNGAIHEVDLIVGTHVRDHFFGAFGNTTTSPDTTESVFGTNAFGSAHYDMLKFDLPASFQGETLNNIVFTSDGPGLGGKAFLAALTVAQTTSSGVPEPTFGISLLGLGAALALSRRRRDRLQQD